MLAQQPTLQNTVGALLLGLPGAAFFVGVSTLQTYIYYHKFPRDPVIYKYSVGILWVLDIFHLALVIHCVYHYTVTEFGNIEGLNKVVWSIKLQLPSTILIVVIVQSLYTYRVWLLGDLHRKYFLRYLSAAVVLAGLVISSALSYKTFMVDTFVEFKAFGWAISVTFATVTAIDAILAGAMCYYLAKSKARSSRHINSKLSKLIAYTLNSGLLTSACSLSALFLWILLPNTMNFEAMGFFLTKLYIGSYLAMLNARDVPREKKAGDSEGSQSYSLRVQISSFRDRTPLSSSPPGSPVASKRAQSGDSPC